MSLGALDKGALQQAWTTFQSLISDEERKNFEKYACNGLDEYITTLVSACKAHRDAHLRIRVIGWFEPIYQVVQRLIPVAAIAIQAYPTPGSLVLGSIVGVLQIAERLFEYQAKTMQILTQMGSKLQTLLTYENDLYEDNNFVNKALVLVFGDILTFCSRAFKFMTHKGSLHARVKGFRWMTFKDFETQLGEIVTTFNSHMGELEARALECDKQRLKEIRAMLEVQQNESTQVKDSQNQRTDRLEELSRQIFNKQTELDDRRNTKEKEKLRARALNWLSPLTFTDSYLRIAERHLEGTGTWLLESPTYQSWKDGQGPKTLWIRGKPGCGKSFLAARVNLDLSLTTEPGSSVACAFFQRADQNVQTQKASLGALAKQLIIQTQKSVPMLEEEYKSESRSETASEKFIWRILEHVTTDATSTYIVIDALDEHEDGDELARHLSHMVNHFRNTKIIVFSRDDVRFEKSFADCARLRPDHGENEKDLRAYLDAVFDDPENPISLSQDIRDQCVEKAQGVILWVRLFHESLRNPILRRKRLKKIGEMQPGLDTIYDELLLTLGFGEQYVKEQAWLIFLLILHARRPMTVAEILEAVVDLEEVQDLESLREESYPNGDYLISICANLIFIDREGIVRLFHESVRNHLESQAETKGPSWRAEYKTFCHDVHQKCAEICLRYLLLKDFDYGGARNSAQLAIRQKKAPFLGYAATSWAWHYKQANDSSVLIEHLQRIVESAPRRELCLQLRLYDAILPRDLPLCLGTTNALQILAIEGLHKEAELLLNDAAQLLKQANVFGDHTLIWCIKLEHLETSLWLLSLADPRKMEDLDFALLYAASKGHIEIARRLIESGANVHTKDGNGDNVVMVAARSNETAMVRLFLDQSVDSSVLDNYGWTALHYAADANNLEMVEALCKTGAEIVQGRYGKTPLHVAAEKDAAVSIKAMFEYVPQLDVNAKEVYGETALHYAAGLGASDAVAVLIELGCNIDLTNLEGRTALFYAADNGHLKAAQLLVNKGADIRLSMHEGRTALHAAAENGKAGLLQTIIRQRPTSEWAGLLNLAAGDGDTVVHSAIFGGDLDILNFAISAGGNAGAKDRLDFTPLHYASSLGNKEMIKPILKASRDPNPRNDSGDTPLHKAAEKNQVAFMQRLFEECDEEGLQLDVNHHNNDGCSPLMRALESGRLQAAELLLKKGAASTARHDGSYPIHIATWRGYVKFVELLLSHPGVDCKGFKDRLPLHFAAASGKVALIQLFIDHFAEQFSMRDEDGHTPLMLALQNEHIEAANYLFDHHTNLTPANCWGENMAHFIARYGDLNLLRRAIAMGYDATAQNQNGGTALMIATECSKMDVVDELLKLYPDSWAVADSLGKTCLQFSAAQGNLELLMRLQRMGADVKRHDLLGRSLLHDGAQEGHLHVVKHLHSQGCPVNDADNDGWTPLMLATIGGYLPVVEYLLEHCALEDVNRVQRYTHRSAMTEAAIAGFSQLYTMLKDAGCNPSQRDAVGYSNVEYRLAPQLELKANASSLERHHGLENIQRYSNMLKHVTEVSVEDLYTHIDLLTILTEGLRCQGDFEFAGLCLMERRWNYEFAVLGQIIPCAICHTKPFVGDMYVCMDCLAENIICGPCHEKYVQDGRKGPEALNELRDIEEKMRAIRMAIPAWFGLEEIVQMAYYFGTESWVFHIIKSYESWELNHNANNVYDAFPRPGHQFVKILSSARAFKERRSSADAFSNDGVDTEIWLKICNDFEKLGRKHPIGQLQDRFTCSGHTFFVVSKKERDRLVTEGIKLDSKYGRITDVAYEELRAKYSGDFNLKPAQESEDIAGLVALLDQLTTFDQYASRGNIRVPATEPHAPVPANAVRTAKQDDDNPAGEFSAVTIDDGHSKSSSPHQGSVVPPATQQLRMTYLSLYPTIIPDDQLWLWARAVQITGIAIPGFKENYRNERLAAMAEEYHKAKLQDTSS